MNDPSVAGSPGALPAVVVTVMDRDRWDANTDNIVVVDPGSRLLTWVPRDLWSTAIGDRVNRAWALGGFDLLRRALAEHGLDVDAAVCVRRGAIAALLEQLTVTVSVDRPLTFLYPVEPERPIEEGSVLVTFHPPREILCGARIHQWLGARSVPSGGGSDLDRIRRQQTFVREVLRAGDDVSGALADPTLAEVSDPSALRTLATVTEGWTMTTIDDVIARSIDGKDVLVRRTTAGTVTDLGRRAGWRV